MQGTQHHLALPFDQLPQRFLADGPVRRTRQIRRGLFKTGGILVQPTRHLPHSFADRCFGFVQPAVCRRFASFLPTVPTNPPYVDPPIDGQDAGGLLSFMPFLLSRRGAVRRGGKRLPPRSPSS